MCYVLRLSLVQDKPEATTVNCCFKYKYKADVPALPEIIRRQQCNACNAAKAVKLPSRIMQGRSCKATCSLGDGLVVGGNRGTAGSLPAILLTWVCRHHYGQEAKRTDEGRTKMNPSSRLLPHGPTTHRISLPGKYQDIIIVNGNSNTIFRL